MYTEYMAGLLIMLFLVHAPISQRFFYYFSCHDVGGRWFLRSDYSMRCYQGAHLSFMPFVVIMMVSFTFVFPMSVVFQLWRNRKRLHAPATKHKYGFLYTNFAVGAEFWSVSQAQSPDVLFHHFVLERILFHAALSGS